jgi:hypothetical protein
MISSALNNALVALAWAAALFLIFLIVWLYYCECQRWHASLEQATIALAQKATIPAWDACRVG